MKKIIVAISILLLVIVAGVFVYLSTMDWSEYKGTIAKQFYELTGKKLIFEGPVSLNVFPETTLNASRVKIAKQTPHKLETLATIENVAVDVSEQGLSRYLVKTAVEEIEDSAVEIHIDTARNYNPDIQIGETVSIPVDIQKFGRIAAQTAKQVVIQGIRGIEITWAAGESSRAKK